MRCMPANLSETAPELNGLLEMERKGGGGPWGKEVEN